LIIATRPLARFLEKPSVVQNFDRLTGGMFMAFGVGLAPESRRV
jgi:threonine/homoserine/homoserine lactone efflux protein